jgi:hypothetical protein
MFLYAILGATMGPAPQVLHQQQMNKNRSIPMGIPGPAINMNTPPRFRRGPNNVCFAPLPTSQPTMQPPSRPGPSAAFSFHRSSPNDLPTAENAPVYNTVPATSNHQTSTNGVFVPTMFPAMYDSPYDTVVRQLAAHAASNAAAHAASNAATHAAAHAAHAAHVASNPATHTSTHAATHAATYAAAHAAHAAANATNKFVNGFPISSSANNFPTNPPQPFTHPNWANAFNPFRIQHAGPNAAGTFNPGEFIVSISIYSCLIMC